MGLGILTVLARTQKVRAFRGMRPYTTAQARFILSHVYCVHHVPESDGFVYQWAQGAGEALCCRCTCREKADLRLYVASEREASEWASKENEALQLFPCG